VPSQASEKGLSEKYRLASSFSCQKTGVSVYCLYTNRNRRGLLMYEILKYVIDIAFVVVVAIAVISAIRKKKKKDGE
jgi:hypothetical protein